MPHCPVPGQASTADSGDKRFDFLGDTNAHRPASLGAFPQIRASLRSFRVRSRDSLDQDTFL